MLGHVVARYFREQGLKVVTLDQRFQSGDELEEFVEAVCREPVAWWVNCIGARPGQEVGVDWLELVNHQLPALCSSYLPKSCGFIHASSDGVFQSQSGACQWDRLPDAVDDYGRTKLLAERSLTRANDWIIRCSIVGPEQDTQLSLIHI